MQSRPVAEPRGHRLLVALRDGHAFDPALADTDLMAAYHVPFDDIVGGSAVEGRLRVAVRAGERVALVGPSGSGKSSAAAFVLSGVGDEWAPVRVPLDVERSETIREPGALARHVLQTVARHAAAAGRLSPSEREAFVADAGDRLSIGRARTRRRDLEVTLPWLLKGAVAEEVELTLEGGIELSAGQAVAALGRLFALLRKNDLLPVLVIDDSDRWIRVPGLPDPTDHVAAFFGRPLRMLAERGVALLVAVHSDYLTMSGYRQQAQGFLDTTVRIPEVPGAPGLAAILDKRIGQEAPGALSADVIAAEALEGLVLVYRGPARGSLRRTLQVAHTALDMAVERGADQVGRGAVDAAAVETL